MFQVGLLLQLLLFSSALLLAAEGTPEGGRQLKFGDRINAEQQQVGGWWRRGQESRQEIKEKQTHKYFDVVFLLRD